ncbi:hypothetical protein CAOG_07015 [Capsaspora owczarzaki ATCC 30864]|uniref:PX domain-containing protein n=1 Tax=Capsaspora owczarzaki (strain ATCC 30864) TaxID=595528 RepID=A0A0D2UP33_CAPO3|nr:hypothetical protein CAOG_07015 [Capsaspora owczarzaki ATCC 30864]KJE96741.1 hypothetical protein CAOG_007015 [Capsaspora owczarzaki ATCC 30864]|eukprot:XP_004343739.1 hypothetical protein CAOG_07015 [Capsaspora owczarzaki ATCC 30864]
MSLLHPSASASLASSSSSSSTASLSHSASTSSSASASASASAAAASRRVISVPSIRSAAVDGEDVTFYEIFLNGIYCCGRRFSEFSALAGALKVAFPSYNFSRFPMKWPFALTAPQIEDRRKQLDEFLKIAMADNGVADSQIMQDFLTPDHEAHVGQGGAFEILVRLPDRTTVSVPAKPTTTAAEVFEMVVKRIGLRDSSAHFFSLFENENGFERKLQPTEYPLQIIRKHSGQDSRTLLPDILVLKKWIFTKLQEVFVSDDEAAVGLLFAQAKEDVTRGALKPTLELSKELQEHRISGAKIAYLDVVRRVTNYSTLFFPPCIVEIAGKQTTATVGFAVDGVTLRFAETPLESKADHVFKLPLIKKWRLDETTKQFRIEVATDALQGWVVFNSDYAAFMNETLLRVILEVKWTREANARRKTEDNVESVTVSLSTASLVEYATWGAKKASEIVYGTINMFMATDHMQQRGGRDEVDEHAIDMNSLRPHSDEP